MVLAKHLAKAHFHWVEASKAAGSSARPLRFHTPPMSASGALDCGLERQLGDSDVPLARLVGSNAL
jgi:hypothetical protein